MLKLLCKYLSFFLPTFSVQKVLFGKIWVCTLALKKVSPSVFSATSCGADKLWERAFLKAQSEFVERKAFESTGLSFGTGFSAYPYIFRKQRAIKNSRRNSYVETLERYAWIEWFHGKDILYSLSNSVVEDNLDFFKEIHKDIKISKLYKVSPKLQDNSVSMVVLYAQTPAGLICGSAVKDTEIAAEENALKELYMHGIGLLRLKESKKKDLSLYEKRVLWISGQKDLLEERLKQQGSKEITVPFPVKYEEIETEYNQAYVVQRCYFEGYNKEFLSKDNEMYI